MEILSLNTLNMNGGEEGNENASKYKIAALILKTLEAVQLEKGVGQLRKNIFNNERN